jgi:hypothetical protein
LNFPALHLITFLANLHVFPFPIFLNVLHLERLREFLVFFDPHWAVRVVPFKATFLHVAIPVALAALAFPFPFGFSSNDSTWRDRGRK